MKSEQHEVGSGHVSLQREILGVEDHEKTCKTSTRVLYRHEDASVRTLQETQTSTLYTYVFDIMTKVLKHVQGGRPARDWPGVPVAWCTVNRRTTLADERFQQNHHYMHS